eukprot:GHUV01041735.1.p1 GENE.GHUV01041735.1~~GHUV01041735.1.p1  ORF type:complete len:128 (-),score=21.22 GHUV01041735.1:280-663(-)
MCLYGSFVLVPAPPITQPTYCWLLTRLTWHLKSCISFNDAPTHLRGCCGCYCCCHAERGLYVRERNDGLYQVVTYLAAKMFDELAINAVVSVIIAAVAFYGIQLQGSFALFWLTYFCTLICGIGKSP